MTTEIPPEALVRRSRHISVRRHHDVTFVVTERDGTLHMLNGIGAEVFEMLDGCRTLGQCAENIARSYGIEFDEALRDAREFIEELFKRGLVELNGQVCSDLKTPIRGMAYKSEDAISEYAYDRCIPLRVDLEVTYACNLACKHCYAPKHTERPLTVTEIENILRQLTEAGTITIGLTGGEPLLRKDLPDIIKKVRSYGFSLRLLTNATLITPRYADLLAEGGVLTVEVSIHGATSATHDRFTGVPGSFDSMMAAVQLLKNRGVRVVMKFLVTNQNFGECQDVVSMMTERGLEYVLSVFVSPRANGDLTPLRFRLANQQLAQLMQWGLFVPRRSRCTVGRTKCRISPSGDVSPCEWVTQPVGNLRRQHFEEIWWGDAITAIRQSRAFDDPDECRTCPMFYDCMRCPAIALLEEGNIHVPSRESCRVASLYRQVSSLSTIADASADQTFEPTAIGGKEVTT